jgi:hypothetical protein
VRAAVWGDVTPVAPPRLRGPELRARRLLLRHLSPAQRQTWKRHRWFEVAGQGCVYRIHEGRAMNVKQLRPGQPVATLCAFPRGVPMGDVLLAQKLMLETDEAGFLRVAHRT